MLTKPFDQITAADIAQLCGAGAHESFNLEFKQELPGKNGTARWANAGDITEHARDLLLREIVAFANAQGGTLVLGIAETEGNPPRADAVNPVVRAHDLAAQLADAARACIDPPLGSLQVRGIETEESTGAGVVVLRTAASPAGPHRVASDGHAFIRRGTSSVKMTMREIQNLTIDLARGFERLDAIFRDTASEFLEWNSHPTFSGTDGAMRITAAPFGRLPLVPNVARRAAEFLISARATVRFGNSSGIIELAAPLKDAESRPVLRGLRLSDVRGVYGTRVDVFDSGMIDLRFRASSALRAGQLALSEILNGTLFVLRIAEWFRRQAETPEWEYALELDVTTPGSTLKIQTFDDAPMNVIALDKRVVFPRLVSRSQAEDEQLVNMLLRDVFDAAGDGRDLPGLRIAAAETSA